MLIECNFAAIPWEKAKHMLSLSMSWSSKRRIKLYKMQQRFIVSTKIWALSGCLAARLLSFFFAFGEIVLMRITRCDSERDLSQSSNVADVVSSPKKQKQLLLLPFCRLSLTCYFGLIKKRQIMSLGAADWDVLNVPTALYSNNRQNVSRVMLKPQTALLFLPLPHFRLEMTHRLS